MAKVIQLRYISGETHNMSLIFPTTPHNILISQDFSPHFPHVRTIVLNLCNYPFAQSLISEPVYINEEKLGDVYTTDTLSLINHIRTNEKNSVDFYPLDFSLKTFLEAYETADLSYIEKMCVLRCFEFVDKNIFTKNCVAEKKY
ncbi:MAG TPA: hypothetical protein VLE02_01205 [Nitrosarchaeum sp.]|nr:hypothetical protein [Nitrosarchaeum sp.]